MPIYGRETHVLFAPRLTTPRFQAAVQKRVQSARAPFGGGTAFRGGARGSTLLGLACHCGLSVFLHPDIILAVQCEGAGIKCVRRVTVRRLLLLCRPRRASRCARAGLLA